MNYIINPNLPEKKVGLVALSSLAGESIKKLNQIGIETLKIYPSIYLPDPVNSHADLQMIHMARDVIFCQSEHLCAGDLSKKFKIKNINEKPGKKYPYDVRLNCTIIGHKIICNTKTISKDIIEYASINNYILINVNQGYSKCSICVLNDNSIITDDKSIYTAAGKFLNDVTLITKGSIVLKGYNYGFIGGCCGMIDKNLIAFNGRIESHNDSNKIIDSLQRNSVDCIELTDNPLTDIGGILPLLEL